LKLSKELKEKLLGSDREGLGIGFGIGLGYRVMDKDLRSEPDRRSEAINFGACSIQIADLNLTQCVT